MISVLFLCFLCKCLCMLDFELNFCGHYWMHAILKGSVTNLVSLWTVLWCGNTARCAAQVASIRRLSAYLTRPMFLSSPWDWMPWGYVRPPTGAPPWGSQVKCRVNWRTTGLHHWPDSQRGSHRRNFCSRVLFEDSSWLSHCTDPW